MSLILNGYNMFCRLKFCTTQWIEGFDSSSLTLPIKQHHDMILIDIVGGEGNISYSNMTSFFRFASNRAIKQIAKYH